MNIVNVFCALLEEQYVLWNMTNTNKIHLLHLR